MSPIHDLTLYAAAHPWAMTAAVLLVLIVLIASLVWLYIEFLRLFSILQRD